MITEERFIEGITQYVIDEILPPLSGLQKVGVGIAAIGKARSMIMSGLLKDLGYQTQDGMVNMDSLYNDVREIINGTGNITQNIRSIGDITFSMNDVENIYRRMK